MAAAVSPALSEPTSFGADKLSYEIFSILESKFLFGYDPKLFSAARSLPETPAKAPAAAAGRVRILSIDGGGRPSDGLLAAASLARLESSLRRRSGDPSATVADFFDVAAGSGSGGVLAAMLFARGHEGRPLFSADEALRLFAKTCRDEGAFAAGAGKKGFLRRILRRGSGGIFRRIFGEATLRDTLKPVLVTCFDLESGAPFLFSRADAVETDGYDFKLSEVCAATCADAALGCATARKAAAAVEMRSVDGRTRIVAVGGGVAMGNPAAAAITHVLHNKQEFPFAAGMEHVMVVSLGAAGGSTAGLGRTPSAAELVRITADSAADIVDQAVAMAFGPARATNYVRIQCNAFGLGNRTPKNVKSKKLMDENEEILMQRNVEASLFRGKKISGQTNGEKLELFAGELMKEQERRKKSPLPTVVVKQATTPSRASSATTSTATTAATTTTVSSRRSSMSPSR